jgi:hypothetical protein
MGGKAVPLTTVGAREKEEYIVGNARLGLWLGERLLGLSSFSPIQLPREGVN